MSHLADPSRLSSLTNKWPKTCSAICVWKFPSCFSGDGGMRLTWLIGREPSCPQWRRRSAWLFIVPLIFSVELMWKSRRKEKRSSSDRSECSSPSWCANAVFHLRGRCHLASYGRIAMAMYRKQMTSRDVIVGQLYLHPQSGRWGLWECRILAGQQRCAVTLEEDATISYCFSLLPAVNAL